MDSEGQDAPALSQGAMLKPSLQLKLGQQLTMTPQLQQAIRLLQLPALELQAHIRELLEKNVMLEPLEENEGTGTFEVVAITAAQPAVPESRRESTVEVLDEPWSQQNTGPADTPWSGEDDERQQDYADDEGQSLQDHLLWQLELARLAPRELAIASAIVDAISDDGYLTESLAEIGETLRPELECFDTGHIANTAPLIDVTASGFLGLAPVSGFPQELRKRFVPIQTIGFGTPAAVDENLLKNISFETSGVSYISANAATMFDVLGMTLIALLKGNTASMGLLHHDTMTGKGPSAAQPLIVDHSAQRLVFNVQWAPPTRFALETAQLQAHYYECWQGLKKHFNPEQR